MAVIREVMARLGQLSLLTKIATIASSSVIIALYLGIYQWVLVYGNAHQMVLPFIVSIGYLIITTLICLTQLSNRKTPTYLVMAYDVQGALLFAAVGVVCFMCWGKAQGKHNIGPPPIPMPPFIDRHAILISAILGISNSIMYVLDAVLTYRDRWKHN